MYMVLSPFTLDFWKSALAKAALPFHLKSVAVLVPRKGHCNDHHHPSKRRSIINRAQVRSASTRRRPSPQSSGSPSLPNGETSSHVIASDNAMSAGSGGVKRSNTMPNMATPRRHIHEEEQMEEEEEEDDDEIRSENSFEINKLDNSRDLPLRGQKVSSMTIAKPVSVGNHYLSPDITVDLNLKLQRTNTSGVSGLYSIDRLSI